jgi:hypothetical protein
LSFLAFPAPGEIERPEGKANDAVDLDGPHPCWDEFLAETFDKDAELISYMQRLCGLALLADVRDHVLPFLHGVGANGKGVLTLQGLLGDADAGGYAVSAPDGFLMTGREGKHETEVLDSEALDSSYAEQTSATFSTSHLVISHGC